jgi:hypothetical protein
MYCTVYACCYSTLQLKRGERENMFLSCFFFKTGMRCDALPLDKILVFDTIPNNVK